MKSQEGVYNYFLPSCLNNCIFSLGTGYGDITYNSRRGILGAVPLDTTISYHLFNVDSNASKTNNDIVKLFIIDTSNLLYSLASMITGLDFNPTGEYVATMTTKVCA